MIRCPKCKKILDYAGLGLTEKLCTQCVVGGALASDDPPEKVIRRKIEEKGQRIKLDMHYVWFKDQWVVQVDAISPQGDAFTFRFFKNQLEEFLEGLKGMEEKDEQTP